MVWNIGPRYYMGCGFSRGYDGRFGDWRGRSYYSVPYHSYEFGSYLRGGMYSWGSVTPFNYRAGIPYRSYRNAYTTWLCDTNPNFKYYNLSGEFPVAVYRDSYSYSSTVSPDIYFQRAAERSSYYRGIITQGDIKAFQSQLKGLMAMFNGMLEEDILCKMAKGDSAKANALKAEIEGYIRELEALDEKMLKASTVPNRNGEYDGKQFRDLGDERVATNVKNILKELQDRFESECNSGRIIDLQNAFDAVLAGEEFTLDIDSTGFQPTNTGNVNGTGTGTGTGTGNVNGTGTGTGTGNVNGTGTGTGNVNGTGTGNESELTWESCLFTGCKPITAESVLQRISYSLPDDSNVADRATENQIIAETNQVIADIEKSGSNYSESEDKSVLTLPDGRSIKFEESDDCDYVVSINKDKTQSSAYDIYYKVRDGKVIGYGFNTDDTKEGFENNYTEPILLKMHNVPGELSIKIGQWRSYMPEDEYIALHATRRETIFTTLKNVLDTEIIGNDNLDIKPYPKGGELKTAQGISLDLKVNDDGTYKIWADMIPSGGDAKFEFDKNGRLIRVGVNTGTMGYENVEITNEITQLAEGLFAKLKPAVFSKNYTYETSAYKDASGVADYVLVPQIIECDHNRYMAVVNIPGTSLQCIEWCYRAPFEYDNGFWSSCLDWEGGLDFASNGTLNRLQAKVDQKCRDLGITKTFRLEASYSGQKVTAKRPISKAAQTAVNISFSSNEGYFTVLGLSHWNKEYTLDVIATLPNGEIYHVPVEVEKDRNGNFNFTAAYHKGCSDMKTELARHGWTNVIFYNFNQNTQNIINNWSGKQNSGNNIEYNELLQNLSD